MSGYSTAEDFLKIVDRKKDMILVSGFNVYPNEVEAVATASGVMECACIGVPDEKTGEAGKLFVVISRRTPPLTPDDQVAHCRKEMTAYKTPKIVEVHRRAAQIQRRQDPARIARRRQRGVRAVVVLRGSG